MNKIVLDIYSDKNQKNLSETWLNNTREKDIKNLNNLIEGFWEDVRSR